MRKRAAQMFWLFLFLAIVLLVLAHVGGSEVTCSDSSGQGTCSNTQRDSAASSCSPGADSCSDTAPADKSSSKPFQIVYDRNCKECLEVVKDISKKDELHPGLPLLEMLAWPSPEAIAALLEIPELSDNLEAKGHVIAITPSGTVVPRCEQKSGYSCEWDLVHLRTLKAPNSEHVRVIREAYLDPLEDTRLGAGLSENGSWWKSPVVYNLVSQSMQRFGFAMLDSFLCTADANELLAGTRASRDGMMDAGCEEVKLNRFDTGSPIRSDKIKWSQDGLMPGCSGLYEATDSIVVELSKQKPTHKQLEHVDFAFGAMFAMYRYGGRYIKHADAPAGDARRLTAILYLNEGWTPDRGGKLRLFEQGEENKILIEVEPRFNRLLLFWSDMQHEVLPSYGDRFAVTSWYISTETALGTRNGFESLFSKYMLPRVLPNRTRIDAMKNAAKNERQRRAITSIFKSLESTLDTKSDGSNTAASEEERFYTALDAYFEKEWHKLMTLFKWSV